MANVASRWKAKLEAEKRVDFQQLPHTTVVSLLRPAREFLGQGRIGVSSPMNLILLFEL